jgi:hypothetical protein
MAFRTKVAGASALALALGAAFAPWGASASGGHAAAVTPGCTPVSNVEAIIDDSGSMSATDPGRLRFNGMQLFIRQNPRDTLGAVVFGTSASVVFPPTPVGGNEASMIGALDGALQASHGATNYVDAFKTATASNPQSGARIFLTDGGQTLNNIDNTNDHRAQPGPVFVIGLQIGSPGQGNTDADRLNRIAAETGGEYFPNVTSTGTSGQPNTSIQDVIATISAQLACHSVPTFSQIPLATTGQSATLTAPVDAGASSANITLNWGNSANQFRIIQVIIRSHGRTVAKGNVPPAQIASAARHKKKRKKPSKLTVQAQGGPTFETVNVSGLKAGTIVYKVQATNVAVPETVSALVSQQ